MSKPIVLAWQVHGRRAPEGATTFEAPWDEQLYNTIRLMGSGLITTALLGAAKGSGYQPTHGVDRIPEEAARLFPGRLLTEVSLVPEDPDHVPHLTFGRLRSMRRDLAYVCDAALADTFQDVATLLQIPVEQVGEYAGRLIVPTVHAASPDILMQPDL